MKTHLRQLGQLLGTLSTVVCAAQIGAQIRVEPLEVATNGGTARGWVATVDLTSPAVAVETLVRPSKTAAAADLVSPELWLREDNDLQLVVNANYFGSKSDGTATIVGVCVADGAVVSPPRSFDGVNDPVLTIDRDGVASIGHVGLDDLSTVQTAVAGVGGSTTSDVAGSLLVGEGQNLGDSARVQPLARHPRTAIGTSEDGTELFFVVVDGRQDDWSVGVTLPELADVLIERGVWDAVNLDGGGSSALIWRDENETRGNRPSDGRYRPVPVSLGVRVVESASASQADGK